MTGTNCRQHFHEDCEAGINKQINMELTAFYVYKSLSVYFYQDDVALGGFGHFFEHSSDEEKEHADKLMKYQNQRGGRVKLQPIEVTDISAVKSGLDAMEFALELEKKVNQVSQAKNAQGNENCIIFIVDLFVLQSLLDLHKVADSHGDAQMMDFLEGEYLKEQVESIKQLSDYVTNLRRNGPGLGEYLFDRHTLHH